MIIEHLMNLSFLAEIEGASLMYGLAAMGGGIGIGLVGAKAAESSGRNPAAMKTIIVVAILFAALIEGLALITLFLK